MPTQQRYGEPVLTVRMPRKLYELIKRQAMREQTNVSAIIREAATAYMQEVAVQE